MVNLAHYAEIKTLLDEVAVLADQLSPNERELFHTLATRYEEPVTGTFDDKTCLEVMLRNVDLRKGYGLKASDATRQVDLEHKSDKTE
jgi:hypothetical protein